MESVRPACAPLAARYAGRVTVENVPVTADELYERRKAERRMRLMDLHESTARDAETAATEPLRTAYANRYRRLIGVPPARRREFRAALEARVNVAVDELAEAFAGS